MFIKSRFSEHFNGFAFAMTNCQLKERIGKRKKLVLYRSQSIVTPCKLSDWFLYGKKVFPNRL